MSRPIQEVDQLHQQEHQEETAVVEADEAVQMGYEEVTGNAEEQEHNKIAMPPPPLHPQGHEQSNQAESSERKQAEQLNTTPSPPPSPHTHENGPSEPEPDELELAERSERKQTEQLNTTPLPPPSPHTHENGPSEPEPDELELTWQQRILIAKKPFARKVCKHWTQAEVERQLFHAQGPITAAWF
jgi:hypothetical protein